MPENGYTVPIGKARVHRDGRDLSIITYAAMVHTAQEAADILAKEGIEIEILDLRTLCPLDRQAITQTVKKTNKVILLHEDTKTGGLAGELAAIINEEAFDDLDGPIVRITAIDTPVPFHRRWNISSCQKWKTWCGKRGSCMCTEQLANCN